MTSARKIVRAPQLAPCAGTCRLTLDVARAAIMANSTTNGIASHLSTRSTAACPSSGSTAWIATARIMKITLAAVPAVKPALAASSIPANTMSAMPRISNPTWVIQLKKEGSLLPLGPNGARLIAKAVVPACGPCRLARPGSTYATFQTAPAHIQNRPLGPPHREPCGTCSMPRCSTEVMDGSPAAALAAAAAGAAPAESLVSAIAGPPCASLGGGRRGCDTADCLAGDYYPASGEGKFAPVTSSHQSGCHSGPNNAREGIDHDCGRLVTRHWAAPQGRAAGGGHEQADASAAGRAAIARADGCPHHLL